MSLTAIRLRHNVCPMRTGHALPAHITQIRGVLAQRGHTQAQLAAALGMTQPAISKRLTGRRPFTTTELEAVADFLGVHLVINLTDAA